MAKPSRMCGSWGVPISSDNSWQPMKNAELSLKMLEAIQEEKIRLILMDFHHPRLAPLYVVTIKRIN